MEKAVAYCRFSSDNQRNESIDAQLRAINDYCKNNNIVLIKTYIDEAQSATNDQRDEFLNMIRDSQDGEFDIVLVHKLDRFARNRYDSAIYKKALRDNGVRLVSVLENLNDSPEAVILESVLEGMNEYYSKNLAREVRKGMNENALKAIANGGTAPLGFNIINQRYEINEIEAQSVKLIFQMYCQGCGYKLIAKTLNEKGYKTKKGNRFSQNNIYDILRNEKYRGCYVWNKRKSKKTGNHQYKEDKEVVKIEDALPRIIDEDTWMLTQSMMDSKLKPRRNGRYFYLLTGYLVCGECGHSYVGGKLSRNRDGTFYAHYSCSGRNKKRAECNNKSIRANLIEDAILKVITDTFFTKESTDDLIKKIEAYINENIEDNSNLVKELEKKKSKLENRLNKLLDLYLDGGINQEVLSQRNEDIDKELALVNMQLKDEMLKKVIKVDASYIRKYLTDFKDKLNNMEDNETKKTVIDTYLNKVEITANDINIYLNFSHLIRLEKSAIRLVEVGGIEPPSKDCSSKASTA